MEKTPRQQHWEEVLRAQAASGMTKKAFCAERGMDDKRKSETASEKERKLPPSVEEYLKKREAEIEFYRQVSPNLKPYYKFAVEEYYKNLKEN